METFFDLKGLFIALLKRLKMIIVSTLILSIGWATLRFVPLAVKYISYANITDSGAPTETLSEDAQPYLYQARRTIVIDPTYVSLNNQVVDVSYKTCEAYRGLYQNREILEPLTNELFAEFQQDDIAWRKKLVDCNYRTRSVLNDEYTLTNFYGQITVDVPTGNVVNLRVHSNNAELSEKTVARFEELLTTYVADATGHFEHTVTVGQIGPCLPEAMPGLTPKTNMNATGKDYVGLRPTLKEIAVSAVKGGILGFAGGAAISILLIFFINVVDISVKNEGSLNRFNLRTLAVCSVSKKKKLLAFADRWVDKLEGYVSSPVTVEAGAKLVCYQVQKLLAVDKSSCSLLVSGCANEDAQAQFSQLLQSAFAENGINCKVVSSGCATYTPDTLLLAAHSDGVILLETVDKSNVSEIQRELDQFSVLEKPVVGFVLLK